MSECQITTSHPRPNEQHGDTYRVHHVRKHRRRQRIAEWNPVIVERYAMRCVAAITRALSKFMKCDPQASAISPEFDTFCPNQSRDHGPTQLVTSSMS